MPIGALATASPEISQSSTPTISLSAASALHAEGLSAVTSVEIDVTSDDSIAAAKAYVEEKYERLDMLINNAGIALDVKVRGKYPLREMMKRTYEVNVFGAAAVTEEFIPLLERSQNPRIVFTSSTVGSLERTSDPTNAWATARIRRIPPARRR